MAVYSAHDVAAEIRKRLPQVPTKKLHKLLYYCQGFHLAEFGHPLFSESLQAWDRGPVVAEVWRNEKHGAPVVSLPPGEQFPTLGQSGLNTIGYVVSRYGSMTGADLEALTHHEAPWMLANARKKLTGDQRMDVDEIRAYFESHRQFDTFDNDLDDPDEKYDPPPTVLHDWLADAPTRKADRLSRDDFARLDDILRR